MLRKLIFISFIFIGLSINAQRIVDRRYYYLNGTVAAVATERPLLQFQVRFSAVALFNDQSPVYYRLRLVLPLKKSTRVNPFTIKGDSLYKTAFIHTTYSKAKRSRLSRLWIYKTSIKFPAQQLSLSYSQSPVRGKIEIRRMTIRPDNE